MLTQLAISNLGVLRDLRVKLSHLTSSLTVFVGPNGSGKTSLLWAIQQLFAPQDPDAGRHNPDTEVSGHWGALELRRKFGPKGLFQACLPDGNGQEVWNRREDAEHVLPVVSAPRFSAKDLAAPAPW